MSESSSRFPLATGVGRGLAARLTDNFADMLYRTLTMVQGQVTAARDEGA